MILRSTIVKLVGFLVLCGLGIIYVGVSLVGFHLPGQGPYTVKADFAESGGIFSNAEVTYRGHPIGRVGGLQLLPNGIRVNLDIDRKWKHIPANLDAVVANQAPIGEQYVDLRPRVSDTTGPYLHAGSRISMDRTSAPIPVENVILDVDKFAGSVNTTELATNISELGQAFFNTGPVLQRLITGGNQLNAALIKALPATRQLINAGHTDLLIAQRTAGAIRTFAQQLDLVGRQLAASDKSFRQFVDNGVSSAQELNGLLQPNSAALTLLLGNLVTFNQITVARIPALKALFLAVPEGFDPIAQTRVGHYVLQGFTGDPGAGCLYTKVPEYAPPDVHPRALDSRGYCNTPSQSQPANNQQQRGQDKAPRPPGDTTANPAPGGGEEPGSSFSGSAYGPPSNPSAATATSSSTAGALPAFPGFGSNAHLPSNVGIYDPYTGLLAAPDGSMAIIGSGGGEEALMGDNSWTALLLGALFH